jgi:spore germination cell wall hydrolase CwlJ-like protein
VAVGAVVMNRVKSSSFPTTILEVIYQNKQFSPVASGRFAVVLARGANETCYQAARDAMSGVSPVGDKLFFRTPIAGLVGQKIGGHIFY